MFNLGQEVFYADVNSGVQKGVVLGYSVNEQGHDVYSIKNGKSFIVVFSTLCFATEDEAKKEIERITPLNEAIKSIHDEANEKIDRLLDEIHGKPQFEHLTIKAEKPE